MSNSRDIDDVRKTALDRIDRSERRYKMAFLAAAIIETFFFAGFLLLADFIATIATYSILALGMLALGVHITRNTLRVLNAVELSTTAHLKARRTEWAAA
jgi:hypothetical protein